MKKLKMNLELSGLGHKTHIWFPFPQGIKGDPAKWLGTTNFKVITDRKFNNKSAYFLSVAPKLKISAEFPIGDCHCEERQRRGNLIPNLFVQSDHPTIKSIANSLVAGVGSDSEKAKKCFDWVIDYLEYANPVRGLYSSVQALTDRRVDCGGFSTLLTALLRATKIPARCVFGWAIESKFGYHAWVEFFDNKKSLWIPCDPSVSQLGKRTNLDAGFGFINDNRIIFSVGEDLDLIGGGIKWNIPLLQSPVVLSLDKKGVPKSFVEKLDWRVID
jgi:transglutaminase-like putative cysteine protease